MLKSADTSTPITAAPHVAPTNAQLAEFFAARCRAERGLLSGGAERKARSEGASAVHDCLYSIAALANALVAFGRQGGSVRADAVPKTGAGIQAAMGGIYDDIAAATESRA